MGGRNAFFRFVFFESHLVFFFFFFFLFLLFFFLHALHQSVANTRIHMNSHMKSWSKNVNCTQEVKCLVTNATCAIRLVVALN